MNVRTYQRVVQPFLATQHLEQVFDIPSSKALPSVTKSLNVSVIPSDQIGLLDIRIAYSECSTLEAEGWQLLDVCEDIEREIYSYLRHTVKLTIEVDFRDHWPYWAPKIKLIHSSNDSEHLTRLVHQFNCDLRTEWSPALGFDKTMLMLLSRILEELKYV